jgi:hypothetical protein
MDFHSNNWEKKPQGHQSEEDIDMNPPVVSFDPSAIQDPGSPKTHVKNIRDTQVWKASVSGISGMWGNYLNILQRSFQRMSRLEQESLIRKICIAITLGIACLVAMFFYGMVDRTIRLIGLPLFILSAYWASTKIVTPMMIVRYDQYLNKEY